MCTRAEPAAPSSTAQALAMVRAGLGYLCSVDAAGLGTAAQAEALIGLEQAEAQHTAARAKILHVFTGQHGFEADGYYGAASWLRARAKVTRAAAGAATAWARRLAAHPVIAAALAQAQITVSLARQVCDGTDQLPGAHRDDADAILLAAVLGGADQYDLARLAREMIERARTGPDRDTGGFDDRAVWLETTLAGAGRLQGDLTPACAAALTVVLEALGQKAGPEEDRTLPQRHHDAIEEACRRLIRARMVPGRDGQPAHLQVHVDLAELRGLAGASVIEAALDRGQGRRRAGIGGPDRRRRAGRRVRRRGHPGGDRADRLGRPGPAHPAVAGHPHPHRQLPRPPGRRPAGQPPGHPAAGGPPENRDASQAGGPATRARLHATILQWSVDLLPGPGGLAAALRGALLSHPFTGLSQPLDIGRATRTIPSHLRAAVIHRDRHCQFPGCTQPPSVCEVHHLVPWAHGGATSLGNLALYCRFHHLIVIHRWGWTTMPRT